MIEDKRDKFDQLLGDKLSELREMPSEGLFDRIEATLAEMEAAPVAAPVNKPKVVPLWQRQWVRLTTAVAAAVALFVGVVVVADHSAPEEIVAEAEVMQSHKQQQDELVAGNAQNQQLATEVAVEEKTHTKTPRLSTPKNNEELLAAVVAEQTIPSTTPQTIQQNAEVVATNSQDNNKSKATKNKNTRRTARRNSAEIEEYWRNVLGQGNNDDQNGKLRLANMKLYATNLGLNQGHMQVNNLASNAMLVSEMAADGTAASTVARPLFMQAQAKDVSKLKHYMPVSAGVNVSWRLNDWLALESGLTYTNLYSESDNSGSISAYHRTQNLHYIGVPLAASIEFVDFGNAGIYVKAGTSVEVCMAAKQRIFVDKQLSSNTKMATEGMQLSLNAAVGANYTMWRGLGLFAEAGVAYWLATKPQPMNYRTEHPLGLSLMAGVRLTFE